MCGESAREGSHCESHVCLHLDPPWGLSACEPHILPRYVAAMKPGIHVVVCTRCQVGQGRQAVTIGYLTHLAGGLGWWVAT